MLTQWALRILHRIFRSGVGYYKAGTTLLEIVPRTNQQFSLFDPAGDASRNDKVDGYTRCDQWAVWSRGAEVGAAAEFGKNRTLSLVGHLKRIDIQSTCRNAVNTRCGMLIRLSCELRQPANCGHTAFPDSRRLNGRCTRRPAGRSTRTTRPIRSFTYPPVTVCNLSHTCRSADSERSKCIQSVLPKNRVSLSNA